MFPFKLLTSSLLALLALTGCDRAGNQPPAPVTAPVPDAHAAFMGAQNGRKNAQDFPAMIAAGKARVKVAPQDVDAWWTMAYASYMQGDLPTAIAEWQRCEKLAPTRKPEFEGSIATAQGIQRRWPGLHLLPPVWAETDAQLEESAWGKKAVDLLKVRRYDEIEAVAHKLQTSKATGIDGGWLLEKFASGMWAADTKADWESDQARIKAWRLARPKSLLAKVAELASWTTGAGLARGDKFADKVTDQQWKQTNNRLVQGSALAPALEGEIEKSPLVALRIQRWALLADMPRETYLKLVKRATTTFPTYIDCDYAATNYLMTRWNGQPGDWENYMTQRADETGGVNGDILYARLASDQYYYYEDFWTTNHVSWPRVKRGCAALLKMYPDSLRIGTDYYMFADDQDEIALARNLMIHVVRNRAAREVWPKLGEFDEARMDLLSTLRKDKG